MPSVLLLFQLSFTDNSLVKSRKVKYNKNKSIIDTADFICHTDIRKVITMRNLADAIENFIIRQLLEDSEDAVLVQRNELADKLSCAPSQISYVLSTRFTPERGFMVESRRGSGGFVRIVRVMPHQLQAESSEPTVLDLIEHWAGNRLISRREKALLQYMMEILDADEQRKRSVLETAISKMTERE